MKMKFFIKALLVFILFNSVSHLAEAQNRISGKVTDNNKETLTGAVAELRNAGDSSLAKVSVTDVNGIYNLENVKAGSYFIKITFLGFNPYRTTNFTFDGSAAKVMEDISMESSAIQLKAAEISALKPLIEVRADKTVFNVETSVNSTGSTALELLQKAPGVVVDNNDNITLKGRGGIMVQIDGRPTHLSDTELADYLKSMQSTDVEAIELISNPSSKYDAEGTAGIINIKLKKNKNFGTNGSVTLGYATGKYSKYNTSISLNNRSRNFNLFGSYSNNWGDRANEFYLYREQQPYIFNQSSISRRWGLNQNYKAGIDYTLNKKNNIGLMINGNVSDINGKTRNRNFINDYFNNNTDSILKSDQTFKNEVNNFNLNLNYHYADTMGHDLTTDFDYGFYDTNRDNYIPNEYVLPDQTALSSSYFRSLTPTTITIYTLKSDYSQNLFKGKLGVGFKTSLVNTDNDFNFYNITEGIETLDNNRSNHFVYTENVNALYANYQHTIKKFDVQAGVRMENTVSEGDLRGESVANDKNVKRDYTDFFPSAGITYNPHKNHSVSLIYSSRIDRPNYQELNPFEYKLDELSFRKGNPFLNPQYSNKIDLSHTYKYTTITSVGYSHTEDFFAQIADTISGGKSVLMPRNLATEDVISGNISTSLQPFKWYSVYLNAGVSNQKYNADFGDNKTINTSFTSFNFYGQNTFKIKYGFSLEISGWYNSGGVWGGAFKTDAQGSLDVGLQKKLFDDKATLKMSYTDILHTAPWKSYNTYAGIVNRANGSWESQQFRISFTWRFGNNQVKSIKQRTTGSEQELKRVGGGE
jgi:iron complex outermembrane recepter protein